MLKRFSPGGIIYVDLFVQASIRAIATPYIHAILLEDGLVNSRTSFLRARGCEEDLTGIDLEWDPVTVVTASI
jgi:hypothetical protein